MKYWKVLFVKPRAEKKVTLFCKLFNIPFYLPLREKTRVVQRRRITIKLPVFPGYVFARLDAHQRLELLQTNLLVRVLEPDNPRPLLRNLIMVRRALRVNPALEPEQPLIKGRLVRIMSGPFMGVEGRVTRIAGKMKVVLNVDLIGRAVSVTAEISQIEAL